MNPLYIVHLKGSQAEMGAQYGRFVREHGVLEEGEQILTTLAWRMLQDANSKTLAGRLTGLGIRGLMSYGVKQMQKHRPKPYLDRTLAFMEVLGRGPQMAEHMLLMDMFQNLVGLAGRYRVGPFARTVQDFAIPSCSSLVTWGRGSVDGALRHARNFDFPAVGTWEAHPAVVFCEPTGGQRYGYVGTFGADVPGTTGFNEAGLTVAAHTRLHRDVRFDAGSIVDLCHDLIARAETLDDAVKIAREASVSCAWGIMVGSARERRAICLETTGNQLEVVEPSPGCDHLTATNLHRHPNLAEGSLAPFPAWVEHADSRQLCLENAAHDRVLGREDLMEMLGDRGPDGRRAGGICAQAISVTSVVMEPESKRMAVSIGDTPTGWGPYVDVDWDWDQPPSWVRHDDPAVISARSAPDHEKVREAYSSWRQAVQSAYERHDPDELLPLVERAIAMDNEAPSYRFIAGILRMRRGEWARAYAHMARGLSCPQSAFRQGQFLLWGARCLDQMDRHDEAIQWRERLLGLEGRHVKVLAIMAKTEQKTPVKKGRLRRLTYSLDLVDAHV